MPARAPERVYRRSYGTRTGLGKAVRRSRRGRLLGAVGGAVATFLSSASPALDPIADAITPGALTFEATDREYEIFVVRRRGDDTVQASDVACRIDRADGTTDQVDGDDGVADEVGNTQSVSTFRAVSGTTTITCVATGDRSIHFVVDEPNAARTIGTWILGLSFIPMLGGAALILLGVRRR